MLFSSVQPQSLIGLIGCLSDEGDSIELTYLHIYFIQ